MSKLNNSKNIFHLDCILQVQNPIQADHWSNKSYSLHTGYLWSKVATFGFVSVSDSGNHRAPAIHAALKPILTWCVDNNISKLFMVSDSPTSQYRNKYNVFLTQQAAKNYNLEIIWTYTEAGHGKVRHIPYSVTVV